MRRRLISRACVLALLLGSGLSGLGGAAQAQPRAANGRIFGTVRDPDNGAVGGARVSLLNSSQAT